MDISGTVVPLSKINNVVGKIPLFGRVVRGKDGHGIMAVDYTVTGTINDPVVQYVKSLSLPRYWKKPWAQIDETHDPQPR